MIYKIVKGTTPTLQYLFRKVNPTDFTRAILTIKQNNKIILEKNLAEAEVGENSIQWTLTQAETLAMVRGKITARLNWKTVSGTRGVSEKEIIPVEENDKNEVI